MNVEMVDTAVEDILARLQTVGSKERMCVLGAIQVAIIGMAIEESAAGNEQ